MAQAGSLWVKLGLTDKNFADGLKKAEKSLKAFGDRLSNLGMRMTTGLSLPLAAVSGAAIKLGMDAVESENLFSVSMGKMSDSARAWSEDLRKNLGLNSYEVRKNIGTFNVMLKSMGLTEDAAFGMSKGLTQLAYDMASFYNLSTDEAFQKLQSGISGEVEPLKRLGIIVNETTIKNYALTHGIIKQGQTMTESQKIVARYGAIIEQTSAAQGDLARTMDSPANKLRLLQSRMQEAAINLGTALLPAFTALMEAITPLTEKIGALANWFSQLPKPIKDIAIALLGISIALGPVLLMIGKISTALSAIPGVLKMVGSSTGVVIGALSLLGYAIKLWVDNWEMAKLQVRMIWLVLQNMILNAVDKILGALQWLLGWVPGLGKAFEESRNNIKKTLSDINNAGFKDFMTTMTKIQNGTKSTKQVMDESVNSISTYFDGLNTGIDSVSEKAEKLSKLDIIAKFGEDIGGNLGNTIKKLMSFREAFMTAGESIKQIQESIGAGFWAMLGPIGVLIKAIEQIVNIVNDFLSSLHSKAYREYKALQKEIGGIFKEGIRNSFSDAIKGALMGASDWKDKLKENIKSTIADGIVAAFMQSSLIQGAIQPLMNQLRDALAHGTAYNNLNTNLIQDLIKKIAATIPGIQASIESIIGPIADVLGASFNTLADTADKVTASLLNVPEGLKIERYRFDAANALQVPQMAAGGYVPARPGGTLINVGEGGRGEYVVPENQMGAVNVTIVSNDPEVIWRKLEPLIMRKNVLNGGSMVNQTPRYVAG